MAQRLPLDSSVIGYWGFDESLETDIAFDESASAANLTVTSSPSVQYGRVGLARSFNGTTTFATPSSSTVFRRTGDLTIIIWARIDNYNTSGSSLRTLVSCGGPTTSDNLLYSLSVDSAGRLVYKHTALSGEVTISTPSATIRTGQIYSIALRRSTNAGLQTIQFFVDNVPVAVSSVTLGGSPSAQPVPEPNTNASASLSVGRSQKETDLAFWQGSIDELSIHSIARLYQPYLREAYYRITLSNDLNRISYFNNIQTISSYEMGGGVRWWCFERDKDLYVVKESPFGNFGTETRLTTVGGGSASLTTRPELIYDPGSDTLLVLFSSGNRIYKLTAQSTDDPATINMPFTADTGSIIKTVDNVEGGRFGLGGGDPENADIGYVNRTPLKFASDDIGSFGLGGGDDEVSLRRSLTVRVAFMDLPGYGFGIFIGATPFEQIGGFRAFKIDGGANTPLPAPFKVPNVNVYFSPISPRLYGSMYYAEALNRFGVRTGIISNTVVDRFNEPLEKTPLGIIDLGRDEDGSEYGGFGVGGGDFGTELYSYINRTPVKFAFEESPGSLGLGGGIGFSVSSTGRGTVSS